MGKLRGLYIITDERLISYDNIEQSLSPALENGASIVQLRDKTHTTEELIPVAIKIKSLCKYYKTLFIVNDNVELALEVDADGVHVGKGDVHISSIREKMIGKIIGVSCYGNVLMAKQMEQQGADYAAFGSFFVSPTKPQAPVVEKKVLQEAKEVLSIPICAIGGITVENAGELVAIGADMIAVISGIFAKGSIAENATLLSSLFV